MIPSREQLLSQYKNKEIEKSIVDLLLETSRFHSFIMQYLQEAVIFKYSDIYFHDIKRLCMKVNRNFQMGTESSQMELYTKIIALLQSLGYGGKCLFHKNKSIPFIIRIQIVAQKEFTNVYEK